MHAFFEQSMGCAATGGDPATDAVRSKHAATVAMFHVFMFLSSFFYAAALANVSARMATAIRIIGGVIIGGVLSLYRDGGRRRQDGERVEEGFEGGFHQRLSRH